MAIANTKVVNHALMRLPANLLGLISRSIPKEMSCCRAVGKRRGGRGRFR